MLEAGWEDFTGCDLRELLSGKYKQPRQEMRKAGFLSARR